MTRNDLVFVACRIVALSLLIPLIFELQGIPAIFYTLEVGSNGSLFRHSGWLLFLKAFGMLAVQALLGIFFWRAGPLAQKVFQQQGTGAEEPAP